MKQLKSFCLALAFFGATAAPSFAQNVPSGYMPLEVFVAPVKKNSSYDVVRGDSLRATLERWSSQAGWQPLVWKLPEDTDFTLGANASFEGDFIKATKAFISSLGVEAELRVRFSEGNKLLVVEPLK